MKFTDTVRFTVAVHMEGGEVAKVLMLTKADEVEDITDYLKEIEKESIKDDCIKQGRIEPADAKYLSGKTPRCGTIRWCDMGQEKGRKP